MVVVGAVLAAALTATANTYQFIEGRMSWHDAKLDAEGRGGYLATITSQQEWDDIAFQIGPDIFGLDLWAGGTDEGTEGTWRWVTGEPWSFTRWDPLNPSNSTAADPNGEHFLHLDGLQWGADLLWNDWGDVHWRSRMDGYILEVEGSAVPDGGGAITLLALGTIGLIGVRRIQLKGVCS